MLRMQGELIIPSHSVKLKMSRAFGEIGGEKWQLRMKEIRIFLKGGMIQMVSSPRRWL